MADYEIYPAVDYQFNFPPPIREALAISPEISEAVLRGGGSPWAKWRNVPADADLNVFKVTGIHRISTPDTSTILNLPEGMNKAGMLEVIKTDPGGDTSLDTWWVQRITSISDTATMWWRSSKDTAGNWNPWREASESSTPVTELHVIIGAGQSNMSGRGEPSGGYRDPVNQRIFEFGSKNQTLRLADVPLDMHDNASGLSPLTTMARAYLERQPNNVGALLIPAAHGGTGFTGSTTVETWTVNAATNPAFDLPRLAIAQAKAAIVAAKAAGYTVILEGILWHQGENNSSLSQSGYAAKLDELIDFFRDQLNDPKLPFIVGQMVPEGIAANTGRQGIDAAHQDTPNRVPYTAFAKATPLGHNPGDTTHMSRVGVEFLGRNYSNALLTAQINAEMKPLVSGLPGQIDALVPPAVSNAIANDPEIIQSAVELAQSDAGLLTKWKPNTTYAAGQQVVNPDGDIIKRISAGTTGASYSITGWEVSATVTALGGKANASHTHTSSQITDLKVTQLAAGTTASALPSTYPVGFSYSSAGDTSWPVQYGTVDTVRGGTARTSQTYSAKSGSVYSRTEIDGDAWGPWQSLDQYTDPALIGTGQDLNTYTTTGVWHQSSNANATLVLNYPEASAGLLEVFKSGTTTTFIYQRYTVYSGMGSDYYWRGKYSTGNWTAWQRAMNDAQVATTTVHGLLSATDKSTLDAKTAAATGLTLAYRNGFGRIGVAAPGTDVTAATPKSYVDAADGLKVDKGALMVSASDKGAVGNGTTNDSAAWTTAINEVSAQGGGWVTAERGKTYVVENLPLLPGVYFDLTGIKLTLPASPTKAMFVAPVLSTFQGGGFLNGELIGVNNTKHCFDFTAVAQLDMYIIDMTYVHHFDRGYTGSQNDRWPLFRGVRWWDNNTGMYIVTNHPIIHFCDFRFNDVGLQGHINDLYVIGTKFNFNRIGTQPAAGGVIINSRFTGCMWFRNTESGLTMTSRNYVGGGGMFVGQNKTIVPDVGLTIKGVGNMIEGMQFGYETTDHCFGGAAIRFSAEVSKCENNVISGNFFSVLGNGPGIDTDHVTGKNIQGGLIVNNEVRVGAGNKWIVIPTNFINNRVAFNSVFVTAAGLPLGQGVIELKATASESSDVTDNTFVSDNAIAGHAIMLGNVNGAQISGNRFKNFASPITTISNWPGAYWGQNSGFTTTSQGEASVLAGSTTLVVAHGLDLTPQRHHIQLTPTNGMGNATKYFISNVDATNFTINVNVAPTTDTARFAWRADVSR